MLSVGGVPSEDGGLDNYQNMILQPGLAKLSDNWNRARRFNHLNFGIIQNISGAQEASSIGRTCRNLTSFGAGILMGRTDRRQFAIPSPGYTVRVLSDGTRTNRLPIDLPNHEITLGALTLRPLWRKNLTPSFWGKTKREAGEWQPPSRRVGIPGILCSRNYGFRKERVVDEFKVANGKHS